MKAKIYVTLKPSVLDPQGKAIQHSAESNGFSSVKDVRQGKFFEVELADEVSAADAKQSAENFARAVLANPVIEDFRVEIID